MKGIDADPEDSGVLDTDGEITTDEGSADPLTDVVCDDAECTGTFTLAENTLYCLVDPATGTWYPEVPAEVQNSCAPPGPLDTGICEIVLGTSIYIADDDCDCVPQDVCDQAGGPVVLGEDGRWATDEYPDVCCKWG